YAGSIPVIRSTQNRRNPAGFLVSKRHRDHTATTIMRANAAIGNDNEERTARARCGRCVYFQGSTAQERRRDVSGG
ncbi:hypothetical protein, partial [Bifidobacterium biavatii]|uniref:hypothetical protein n=1 Tax=Bifidobacterium biavatii TaxID=762212 RepID=UPI0019D3EC89